MHLEIAVIGISTVHPTLKSVLQQLRRAAFARSRLFLVRITKIKYFANPRLSIRRATLVT